MIRYFAEHPTAANILMTVIILSGLVALPGLNKETFPAIDNRKVQVSVHYPGASPLEAEDGICKPLEEAVDGINFLEEQQCVARENSALLTLTMLEAGAGETFLADVKSAVDGINTFPDAAEEPLVEQLGRTQPVVSVAITAELTQRELKALAEYYRAQLLKIPAIPIVRVEGFSKHELRVQIRTETLRQYGLSVEEVANLIRRQAIDLPLGTIKTQAKDYQIRFANARRSIEELAELIIINSELGGQVRLGDIATIIDKFEDDQRRTEINGMPAAILSIKKNTTDDTLTIYNAVADFVAQENRRLPDGTRLLLTEDSASVVADRLRLLLRNGWQGLLLASLVLALFFTRRYTLWVALGLPVAFIGGLMVMSLLGVTINMISMVALLMAIGILMDDAIVIAESIASEYRATGDATEATLRGVDKVKRGVLSSFATSAMLFGSLLFLEGDMGQVMSVLPMVLLAVLSISLIEAFFILPHHLKHALAQEPLVPTSGWRRRFETTFEKLRQRVGLIADWAIERRYFVVGLALALLMVSVSLIPAGVVKFKFFPDLEGDVLEARILLPQGTPFTKTQTTVDSLLLSLQKAVQKLTPEPNGDLVQNIQIAFSKNSDAGEEGEHLATIKLDLLNTESRVNSLHDLKRAWSANFIPEAEVLAVQFKEPTLGPAGQAIAIRLQGNALSELSEASWKLQRWLQGYQGVSNVMDDLRPGKPQFVINLYPGGLNSGISAETLSNQLRAAYQGIKVADIYLANEAYEINVALQEDRANALAEIKNLPIFNAQKTAIPLSAVARVDEQREYSRVSRVNHVRTVFISGDIDNRLANTNEIINDTRTRFLPQLKNDYPDIQIALEGEVKNSRQTNSSIGVGFLLGIAGIYLLLSLQFKNYREPLIVMINIPLALIGVILGHLAMGLDLTMPSMIGFVSLAGIVVNDSILLVEFVKQRQAQGLDLRAAAGQAARDRFRAIFLTSITTIAGMLPLLTETSLQAQILVPLVTSVVFGMMSSTLLILLVLPSAYAILQDLGFTAAPESSV